MTETALWPAPLARHPLDATVAVPGSKSLSNRYLLLAALGTRPVRLEGLLRSRDTALMMAALRELGVSIDEDPDDPTIVTVTPPANGTFHGNVTIYCGLAGTVMRFVPALVLFADGPVHIDGDEQAYARPMKPVLDGLEQLGCAIEYQGRPGFLPCTVTPPRTLPAGHVTVKIDSSQSSQFISGLLLVASRLPDGMTLVHTGEKLPSMPHIRMTMEDVALAGGEITMPGHGRWKVAARPLNLPGELVVEPDLSNAAPFLGAALIAGGSVQVPRWPATTAQPGGLLPDMLRRMGATVTFGGLDWDKRGDCPAASAMLRVTGAGTIRALGTYDLSAAGEIAPSIAALCTLADGPSELTGIAHLRGHETDRLHALATEIERVGAHAHELPDGIAIEPVSRDMLHGAVMETYADHRMATFAAMLGLVIPHIEIVNIATTSKTLPDFVGMWTAMLQ